MPVDQSRECSCGLKQLVRGPKALSMELTVQIDRVLECVGEFQADRVVDDGRAIPLPRFPYSKNII